MSDDPKITSPNGGIPHGNNNHNQSTSDKKNYIARLPTFSGNSTEFDRWKSKMYTHIIGFNDECHTPKFTLSYTNFIWSMDLLRMYAFIISSPYLH